MPRFVILEHDHPHLHWDLMLEAGDKLQTWRLAQPPTPDAGPIDATALNDHRRAYLDFEGPVSGQRGVVKRWDTGTFAEAEDSTRTDRRFVFDGQRVRGHIRLRQIQGSEWLWDNRQQITSPI